MTPTLKRRTPPSTSDSLYMIRAGPTISEDNGHVSIEVEKRQNNIPDRLEKLQVPSGHLPKKNAEEKDRYEVERFEPESYIEVPLHPTDTTRFTQDGGNLEPRMQRQIANMLQHNSDIFAFSTYDLIGVDPSVIQHRLNIDPGAKPIRQKKRNHGRAKDIIIAEEVKKLLDTGHIVESQHSEWLCNVVLVRKADNK
jgi:hypothetical protein